MAYLPSGAGRASVDVAFFQQLRSSCYIISGDDPQTERSLRGILDALLEGKAAWPHVQVRRPAVHLKMRSQRRLTSQCQQRVAVLTKGSVVFS